MDKEWETHEKIPAWDKTKVRNKYDVIVEARIEGIKVHFESCMNLCHLKTADKAPKIQRSNCTPRRHRERRFWILCSIYRTRIMSITNDGSKSHGYHIQIARFRWTSSGRSICLYPIENGRCSHINEHSKIGMSRHLGSSTTTQKTQLLLLSGICTVILWQDCYGKGNLRKFFLKYGWEKVSNWECLFVHREKGLFLSVYVDDIKLAGKKQNINPMWKVLNKEVGLGERTSFLDRVCLVCTQRQCPRMNLLD